MPENSAFDLPHYWTGTPSEIENRLVAAKCIGRVIEPAEFALSSNSLLGDAADLINHVLDLRARQFEPHRPLKFIIVERDQHRAFVTRGTSDDLIVFTRPMLEVTRAIILQITQVEPLMEAFGIVGKSYGFPAGDGGRGWVARLVTRSAPPPSRQQLRAGTELANLVLAILVNHEVGHVVNGHFDVRPGTLEVFEESCENSAGDTGGIGWSFAQCLEVDADGVAIDLTLKDCLAGYYAPNWRSDDGQVEVGSVLIKDTKSAVQTVMFANLLLWAFFEHERDGDTDWFGSHPPFLYRCLVAAEVTDNVLVVLTALRVVGAPVIDVEDSRRWFVETLGHFERVMQALGSEVVSHMADTFREEMDQHTERLLPSWTLVRERLPRYQGRPRLAAKDYRVPEDVLARFLSGNL